MNFFFIFLAVIRGFFIGCRCFPFRKAVRCPMIVGFNVDIQNINRYTLELKTEDIRFGMIKIGVDTGSSGIRSRDITFLGTDGESRIVMKGSVTLCCGGSIKATRGGIITLGDNCHFNCRTRLLCAYNISIGNNVLTGWDVTFKDNDGHNIFELLSSNPVEDMDRIIVGDHVWIGSQVTLLKGSAISDDSIIGWGSVVTRCFRKKNIVIAGCPAKEIRDNINWAS